MRLLSLGDNQLGVATVTLESQERVWDQIVTIAIENGADGVLHGGDLFEHATPTADVVAVFRRPLARLRDAGIPMLLIRGNHDGAVKPVDAIDVFHEYPGLRVSQRPELIRFAGAQIVTLPWVHSGRLVAAANGGDRDAIHQHAMALLLQAARDLYAEASGDLPTVLLAHWSISGASLPTGLPVDQLREPVIEWADLDAIGFDAVVAAHIHKAQRLDDPALGDTTPGVYVGSPQPLSHGEGGYEHGVWLLDVEPGNVGLEFLPIESPQFLTFDQEYHHFGPDDWNASRIHGVGQGDVVRVRYTATREQDATIDKDQIRRELLAAGASRVTVEPTITREVRARDERMTQELSDLDALAIYCEAQDLESDLSFHMRSRLNQWISA